MPSAIQKPRTLYDKVFQDHVVNEQSDGTILLYIGMRPAAKSSVVRLICLDRHLVHEVTSPQAFEGLRNAGRKVRRPDCTLATTDHVGEIPYQSAALLTVPECPYLVAEELQECRRFHQGDRFAHPVRDPGGKR